MKYYIKDQLLVDFLHLLLFLKREKLTRVFRKLHLFPSSGETLQIRRSPDGVFLVFSIHIAFLTINNKT